MDKLREDVKGSIEPLRTALDALANLVRQEAALRAEGLSLAEKLSKAPLDSLVVGADDDKAAGSATSRLLAAKEDVRLKLDLIPAIRARFRAKEQGQAQIIRRAVRALAQHYAELAEARAKKESGEVADFLARYHAGDGDTAQVAAARALQAGAMLDQTGPRMPGSKTLQMLKAFRSYVHPSDPLQDAEAALALAAEFDLGEAAS